MLGARLLARQKTAAGDMLAQDSEQVSQMSLDTLCLQSAISLLDAAFAEQGEAEHTVSSSAFLTASLKQRQRQLSGDRENPVGTAPAKTAADGTASASKYCQHDPQPETAIDSPWRFGNRLLPGYCPSGRCRADRPAFSEVAGAVGAAAGSVRQRVMILVTQPKDGVFRIHLPDGLQDKSDLEEALALARTAATEMATRRATAAGAHQIETSLSEAIDQIDLGADKSLFLQAAITADATGTPA